MQPTDFQIILYYYYGHLTDAAELVELQRALCNELGLKGRILIAEEGMNGTLEGTIENTEAFIVALTADPRFAGIHMKRSKGPGDAFRKLVVKLRSEIVTSVLGQEDFNPADFTAPHLTPEELHQWFEEGKEFFIVDMRNDYEHAVGHFAGSVLPKMKHFRDLAKLLPELEHLKDKTVVTVCTGGVRCEKASGFLLRSGFREVYQLFGGIVSYMEKYPNQHFDGKLYVFDKRIVMGFNIDSPEHKVIGRCEECGMPSEHFVNDDGDPERRHFICCEACASAHELYMPAAASKKLALQVV